MCIDSTREDWLTYVYSTSMNETLTSTRNLNILIHQVLKFNVNMFHKLRNIECMHSALAALIAASSDNLKINEQDSKWTINSTFFKFAFEENLQTLKVYRRTALNELRFSKSSFINFIEHSFLSELSLSNIFDINAIFLFILSMKFWNHHRYNFKNERKINSDTFLFETWYNSSSMIRQSFQQLCIRKS